MKRRSFIKKASIGTVAGLGLAAGAIRLSNPKSGNYSEYFAKLNTTLKNYEKAIPFLVVDLDLLDANLKALKIILNPKAAFRVVVKSLPSPELLNYVMASMNTKKLMAFHQPFISDLAESGDTELDILVGKPMPVKTASFFYEHLQPNGFDASKQIQWLIDTEKRLNEYLLLAKTKNLKLLLNVEIDVGMHRGGFKDLEGIEKALTIIQNNPDHLTFGGFMGYDAHITKVPSLLLPVEKGLKIANDIYTASKALVQNKFPKLWHENLTFNGAGSPTILLHQNETPLNDISGGSLLVKPTDFDIKTLESFVPASFIATPVLKKEKNVNLPSIEGLNGTFKLLNPNASNTFYIYGGSWLANPESPKGIAYNSLFGKSTNQVMMNASDDTKLDVDDFVFFRPHQSEFVFLQFGGILGIRNGEIKEKWSVLQQNVVSQI